MSDKPIKIPTIADLILEASAIEYTVDQPNHTHTHVLLELDSNHLLVPLLAKYALLVCAGLAIWEDYAGQASSQRPDLSLFRYRELRRPITHLMKKPSVHYRGWIGELVIDFVLRLFVSQRRDMLEYAWEEIRPPKTEVTDGELDIVAAYGLTNEALGHVSGEVKTYHDLAQAKSKAYEDLQKAKNWTHNRDAQLREALHALLRPRLGIGALEAAKLAMGDERSFLPGLVHSATTRYSSKQTFEDFQQRFEICNRPSQLIGVQIAISDFLGSSDVTPPQVGFFENFIRQMRLQAICWKKPLEVTLNV